MMVQTIALILQAVTTNTLQTPHPSAEKFVKLDPYGIGMAIIAMSVVFCVLATMYLIFKNISGIYNLVKNRSKKEKVKANKETVAPQEEGIPSEVSAAIGMALHLYYNQQHDIESLKLTIQKVSRIYSPWSSKIYSMHQNPR